MEKVKDRILVHMVKAFALAVLILTVSVLIPGRPAQAAAANISLSMNKTYKSYDITNDGKKDTLRIKPSGSSYGYYNGFKIIVNGKTAYTIKNTHAYDISANLLTLSNEKSFLWLHVVVDSDAYPNLILKYNKKSGKFKKVVDFDDIFSKYGSHVWTEIKKVSGEKIVVNIQMCSYALGSINFDMTFTYKSGTLNYAKTMKNCKVSRVVNYVGKTTTTLTAKRNLTAYSTKKLSGKKYTIKKNTKVKIKCFYLTGSKFEYKMDVNGKTRWMKFSTSYSLNRLFKNLLYYG